MKINVGTKEELEVVGYKQDRTKRAITIILCILSGGLLLLLLSWKPSIRMKFTHVPCGAGEAEIVLVKDIYNQVWEEEIEEEDCVAQDWKRIKRKYFCNKKIKYIWDDEAAVFARLSFPPPGTCVSEMRSNTGLSTEEARKRQHIYGENTIYIEIPTIWNLFVSQAYNPFYIFQVYTVIVWFLQLYAIYAACIFFLSVISITLNIWETRRQARSLREKMMTQSTVEVIRDGKAIVLESKEIVPGDLVNVVAGSHTLEADMVLLEGSTILNEAILTGESVPVTKVQLDRSEVGLFDLEKHKRHILHCGTHVLQVRGGTKLKALVTQTGYDTVKGDMIRSILFPKPLDFHIYSDFLRLIFIFIILGLAAMTWSLIYWSMNEEVSLATMIFNSIDLLTFVVPPIIPATITAINLWAQKRLQKQQIFCLSSNYISLAGPVDIICFDKTGTLTEDDLSLESIIPSLNGEFLPPVKELSKISNIPKFTQTLATCHSVVKDCDGNLIGNPLDIKIFSAIDWKIVDMEADSKDSAKPLFMVFKDDGSTTCHYEVFKTYPFESSQQRMTVIGKERSKNGYEVFIKGAPEKIANLCVKESVPDVFFAVLEWYTKQGLRILAAASRQLPNSLTLEEINNTDKEVLEQGSTFLGLIILQNRLKPETSPVLHVIHNALINTVMVTGDNLLTATSIARQCHLVKSNQQIIFVKAEYVDSSKGGVQHINIRFTDSGGLAETFDKNFSRKMKSVVNPNYVFGIDGESFRLLSQYDKETFKKVVHRGRIFARMKPDQKIEVIEELQHLGHQVAMCGDGCNDCGALKAAHAGISLSTTEASVAAPFTSLQQDIGCMTTLIREGRATLMSSYVSFKYNISYNFSSLIVVLFIFTKFTEPSDTQYLIMDLVLITVPSLVMGNTAAAPDLGVQKPTKRVVHPLHITSIISFLFFQTILYWLTWKYLEAQSWFEPFILLGDEYRNRQPPGYESTVIIMQAFWAFVIAAVVFSHDFPFRKPFYTNKILTAYLIFSTTLCLVSTFCQVDGWYTFLDFKPYPYSGFTWTIFFSVILTGVICYFWERWFLYGLIEKIVIPWIRRLWGARLPYEHLEQALQADTKWPKLDNDDGLENNGVLIKNALVQLEDPDTEMPQKHHGFYRKSTKHHKFTADVKYVDELKPLPVNRDEEKYFDTAENSFHSDSHDRPEDGGEKLKTFLQKKNFGKEDDQRFENDSPKQTPSDLENNQEIESSLPTYEVIKRRPLKPDDKMGLEEEKNPESGANLIKEMNKEWAKIRNSLHESMKEFEMQASDGSSYPPFLETKN